MRAPMLFAPSIPSYSMLLTLSAWWLPWLARVPTCGHLAIVFGECCEKYTNLRIGEWGSGLGLVRNPC